MNECVLSTELESSCMYCLLALPTDWWVPWQRFGHQQTLYIQSLWPLNYIGHPINIGHIQIQTHWNGDSKCHPILHCDDISFQFQRSLLPLLLLPFLLLLLLLLLLLWDSQESDRGILVVCIITVGHWSYSAQSGKVAAHSLLCTDILSGQYTHAHTCAACARAYV